MKRKIFGLSSVAAVLLLAVIALVSIQPARQIEASPQDDAIAELRAEIAELRTLVELLITNQAAPAPAVVPHPMPTFPPINQPPAIQPSAGVARLDEVARHALSLAGGGVVRHICLDWERGVAVYHVRIYHNGNRVDYYLNRDNFEIVRERTRQHNNASPTSSSFRRRAMDITPSLTFAQAAQVALDYMGGTFREISRSYIGPDRNATPVFDVDITAANGERWCFYIDIHTGAILRYHRER
ncbi:MAG: PepSY domain-containing protein [Clostridiales bacterium]|jgi:uncharacterized membrane protein YkoI|nr:PepSY domain-containing protein [Clostridiales bacterium]